MRRLAESAKPRNSSSFSKGSALIRIGSDAISLTDTRADLDLAEGTAKLRRRQSGEEPLAERIGRMGDDMTATSSMAVHTKHKPCLKITWPFIAHLWISKSARLRCNLIGASLSCVKI
jgi:hypothetical protein